MIDYVFLFEISLWVVWWSLDVIFSQSRQKKCLNMLQHNWTCCKMQGLENLEHIKNYVFGSEIPGKLEAADGI